ncbi:MAG: hypothetical protein ACLQK4_01400 [Acidimicrobiales bacterium]|jgi:hypothetical protein
MSAYVEAGYTIVLCTLAAYSASVIVRERAARRRLWKDEAPDDESELR